MRCSTVSSPRQTGTASDVRKHLSRLFNWAIDREIIAENPLSGLKRKDLQYKADAGRALTDDELRAIWKAAQRMGYPFGPYFQLMILTGQRRTEWADAKHSEVCPKRKVLEIPKVRFKGRRDHVVPLAPEAWAIYAAMPRWNGADPFLFSTQAGEVPISGFSKAKTSLDELATEELRKVIGDPEASREISYSRFSRNLREPAGRPGLQPGCPRRRAGTRQGRPAADL